MSLSVMPLVHLQGHRQGLSCHGYGDGGSTPVTDSILKTGYEG